MQVAPKSSVSSRIRRNASTAFQLVKRGNIEYIRALSWMSYMLATLYFPSAMKEKVADVNRAVMNNLTAKEAEVFLAREVTTLSQYTSMIRTPLELFLGPIFGAYDYLRKRTYVPV